MAEEWVVVYSYDHEPRGESIAELSERVEHTVGEDATFTFQPPNRAHLTVHVDAENGPSAIRKASQLVENCDLRAVFRFETWVALEAMPGDEYERRANAPTLPVLVGASEVGEMLGVTRQRVHQLSGRPDFPVPLVKVAMGPLWDARAIRAFAEGWARKAGRPARSLRSGSAAAS